MPEPSDIAIMLDDSELIRLVASWPKLNKEQREDTQEIAIIANLEPRFTSVIVKRAKAHGLILEDGTVNEFAQKYINSLVGAQLKKLSGKPSARQTS